MATQTVTYTTRSILNCENCLPADIFLCVPLSIIEDPPEGLTTGILDATLTAVSIRGGYRTYTIEYDDSTLVEGVLLTQEMILGAVCKGCLTNYINYVSIINTRIAIGDLVVDGTPGSILFIGAGGLLAEDNPNLFYNDASNFVGIGTNTPNNLLQVANLINFDNTGQSTYLGYQTGLNLAPGATGNTFLGYQAGKNQTAGNSNIVIGSGKNLASLTGSFQLNIGDTLYGDLAFGNIGIGTPFPLELLSLGRVGIRKGVLSFAGNTSGKVIVQPAAAAGTWTWTLPTDDGTSGQFLSTDGAGITSWSTVVPGGIAIGDLVVGGTPGSVLFIGAGGLLAQDNANFFYDDTNNRLGVGNNVPLAKIGITGNLSVGATYGTLAAPANGLIVEGNTGLGTTSASQKLTVVGNGTISSQFAVGAAIPIDAVALISGTLVTAGAGTAAFGLQQKTTFTIGGDFDEVRGIDVFNRLTLGAFIGNIYSGLNINNPTILSGTLNTSFGVYIATMTRGSVQNTGLYVSAPSGATLNVAAVFQEKVGIFTDQPQYALALGGTVARTFGMNRNITGATAGQGFTITAGGNTVGGANLDGGDLLLKSGISSGTGTSAVRLFAPPAAGSSAIDNAPLERLTILGSGFVGVGNITPAELLSLGTSGTTKGVLSFAGNTSGKIIVQPAAAAGTWTMTLPIDDGASGQFLTTDGAGITSWTTGGSGVTASIGGPITSGTTGSVLFVGPGATFAQDNANFFYDDTANQLRLGIGNSSAPAYTLNLTINGATTGFYGTAGENGIWKWSGAGTPVFKLSSSGAQLDNGRVLVFGAIVGGGDVAFSRIAANVVGVGTGAAGNITGTLVAGNIGVGTATPAQALTVVGNTTTSGQLAVGTTIDATISGLFSGTITTPGGSGNGWGIATKNTFNITGGNDGAYGIDVSNTVSLGALATNNYGGINIHTPTVSAGALSRTYGIFIHAMTSGSTDNYGLYVDAPSGGSGTNASAVFVGKVGIGTVFPDEGLSLGQIGGSPVTMSMLGSVSGKIIIKAGGVVVPWTLTLPLNDGAPGEVLTTDGAGVTSWAAGGGGGMAIGGTVTSGTTGSLLFVGAGPVLAQDNANLFWDDTNNFLGIGTVTPNNFIQVAGLINFDVSENDTYLGYLAGASAAGGGFNTFVGHLAGTATTTGGSNIALGNEALRDNETGAVNIAIGDGALRDSITSDWNVAVGSEALRSLTTGEVNLGIGFGTLLSTTSGDYNIAIGDSSLTNNIDGVHNIGIGVDTFSSNLSGSFNIAIGVTTLSINETGDNNIGIGELALAENDPGSNNVAVGVECLIDVTSGDNNTAIGYATGGGISTGSNNTILGANVLGLAAGLSNNIIIADGTGTQRINVISDGTVIVSAPFRLKGYTVATLPAGVQGDTAFATDALAPTFLATVVGGGAVVTPVFYNGAAWVGF